MGKFRLVGISVIITMSKAIPISSTVDWQSELIRIATKHHVIVCWVAIILNPIWFVADYFTIPGYWKIFFALRMIVAGLTLVAVLIRKKINLSTELLMLIPVLGISLQNILSKVVFPDPFSPITNTRSPALKK